MANWFLGRALAEEAETENAPWSFLGEGVTFWVTVAVLLVVGVAVYLVTRKRAVRSPSGRQRRWRSAQCAWRCRPC